MAIQCTRKNVLNASRANVKLLYLIMNSEFARYVNKQYLLADKKGKTTKRSRRSHTT